MSWQKQSVGPGDLITSAWGNHIQDQYEASVMDAIRFFRKMIGPGGRAILDLENNHVYIHEWSSWWFQRYDLATGSITRLADGPDYSGGDLSIGYVVDGKAWYLHGDNLRYYTIANNTWGSVALGITATDNGEAPTDGTYIYVMRSTATGAFRRVHAGTLAVSTLAAPPAGGHEYCFGKLAFWPDRGNEGSILYIVPLASQVNNEAGDLTMYLYDIETDSWSAAKTLTMEARSYADPPRAWFQPPFLFLPGYAGTTLVGWRVFDLRLVDTLSTLHGERHGTSDAKVGNHHPFPPELPPSRSAWDWRTNRRYHGTSAASPNGRVFAEVRT